MKNISSYMLGLLTPLLLVCWVTALTLGLFMPTPLILSWLKPSLLIGWKPLDWVIAYIFTAIFFLHMCVTIMAKAKGSFWLSVILAAVFVLIATLVITFYYNQSFVIALPMIFFIIVSTLVQDYDALFALVGFLGVVVLGPYYLSVLAVPNISRATLIVCHVIPIIPIAIAAIVFAKQISKSGKEHEESTDLFFGPALVALDL